MAKEALGPLRSPSKCTVCLGGSGIDKGRFFPGVEAHEDREQQDEERKRAWARREKGSRRGQGGK